eukprot:COSAG05_NODE_4697_length_1406_cov_1.350421_1_plen_81_part_00
MAMVNNVVALTTFGKRMPFAVLHRSLAALSITATYATLVYFLVTAPFFVAALRALVLWLHTFFALVHNSLAVGDAFTIFL